jgi:hypothetical protein
MELPREADGLGMSLPGNLKAEIIKELCDETHLFLGISPLLMLTPSFASKSHKSKEEVLCVGVFWCRLGRVV